jgi:catechol 2,3-dioxygenase
MAEPPDLAHIAHAELLTPFADQSLAFFVDLFGMQIEHREGQSVFLRGWGEYQPYGLKLTESRLPGLGHTAIRAWSAEALARRVDRIEGVGLGDGWTDGDHGHGPAYQFRDPDGHRFELFYEQDRYVPPEHLRPRLRNVPQRHVDRGASVKRIDHVNVLAADVAANRRFATEQLGYRLYEQIVLDDGREAGAWMSLSIAAHELIYTADHAGSRTTLGRPGRGRGRAPSGPPQSGRLHHLAWFVDTREELLRAADLFLDADVPIEAAPSKHAIAQGMFLYVYEPGGNRVEVTTGTHFIYDPEYEPVAWTEAERARGQAWGVKTIDTFHTYGTPDLSGEATGPPLPPTSEVPTGAPW